MDKKVPCALSLKVLTNVSSQGLFDCDRRGLFFDTIARDASVQYDVDNIMGKALRRNDETVIGANSL